MGIELVEVNGAGSCNSGAQSRCGNLVEDHTGRCRGVQAEYGARVPRNGFALAVIVRTEVDLGTGSGLAEIGYCAGLGENGFVGRCPTRVAASALGKAESLELLLEIPRLRVWLSFFAG